MEYTKIKEKLIDYAKYSIKKIGLKKQNEQKSKELNAKNQQLSQLQTKYDMEVRTKGELIQFLSYYRKSPFIPLIASDSFFDSNKEKNQPLLNEFLKAHSLNKNYFCYTVIIDK